MVILTTTENWWAQFIKNSSGIDIFFLILACKISNTTCWIKALRLTKPQMTFTCTLWRSPPPPPIILPEEQEDSKDPFLGNSQQSCEDNDESIPSYVTKSNTYGVFQSHPCGWPSYTPDELFTLNTVSDSQIYSKCPVYAGLTMVVISWIITTSN